MFIRDIYKELKRAEKLHPEWTGDQVHQVAVMVEEAGEALQAALNYTDHHQPFKLMYKEVIHTAAMCFRWYKNNKKKVR